VANPTPEISEYVMRWESNSCQKRPCSSTETFGPGVRKSYDKLRMSSSLCNEWGDSRLTLHIRIFFAAGNVPDKLRCL